MKDLHRTSEAMQEYRDRTFAQHAGMMIRSLIDLNQTRYSTPAQNILGESSQQSQPAGSKAIFPLSNTQIQGEGVEIPDQRPYIRLHVSNILSLKGEFNCDILL